MNNQVKRQLKKIAEALPKVYYKGNAPLIQEVVDLRSREVKNSVVNSPAIISDNSEFLVTDTPTLFEVNHLRRIKKAYNKDGWDGVKNYIAWCKNQDEKTFDEVKLMQEISIFDRIIKEKIKPIF